VVQSLAARPVFNRALTYARKVFLQTGEALMEKACEEERSLLVAEGVSEDPGGSLATKVTFDGSWPKRYGHNSLWVLHPCGRG
jgi:hypothetical protein